MVKSLIFIRFPYDKGIIFITISSSQMFIFDFCKKFPLKGTFFSEFEDSEIIFCFFQPKTRILCYYLYIYLYIITTLTNT